MIFSGRYTAVLFSEAPVAYLELVAKAMNILVNGEVVGNKLSRTSAILKHAPDLRGKMHDLVGLTCLK